MAIKIKPGGSRKVKGMPANKGFSVSFVPTPRSYPAQVLETPLKDCTISTTFSAYETQTEPDVVVSGNTKGLSMRLLPWPGQPRVTAILRGNQLVRTGIPSEESRAHLEVTTEYGSRRYLHDYLSKPPEEPAMLSAIGTSTVEFSQGTLAQECFETCWELFEGVAPGKASNSQFLDGGNYGISSFNVQANPNFLGAELDFSGVSVGRSGENSPWLPFTLIGPRHAVFAAHIDGSTVGDQVLFRRPNGTTQTVTILAESRFPQVVVNGQNQQVDLALVYLSEAVTGCATYKVLPADWERYLPCMDPKRDYPYLPVTLPSIVRAFNPGTTTPGAATSNLYIDNDSPKLLFKGKTSLGLDAGWGMTTGNILTAPPWPEFAAHWRALYPGDSSSPEFLLVREQAEQAPTMVLIGALYAITAGFGGIYTDSLTPLVSARFDWVNQKMNEMAVANGDNTPYALQVVDLSRFNTYTPYGET